MNFNYPLRGIIYQTTYQSVSQSVPRKYFGSILVLDNKLFVHGEYGSVWCAYIASTNIILKKYDPRLL